MHAQVTHTLLRQVGELQLAQRILETSGRRCNIKPDKAVKLAKLFYAVGEAQGTNPALLAAVGRHESCYNQKARGKAKEIGMMQILPSTGRALGFSEYDLQDVTVNVTAAAMLLSSRPKEPIEHTLLAYNQGHARPTGNTYGSMVAATYRRML
jgi:soluble lytic murein transglycosylase-like protein